MQIFTLWCLVTDRKWYPVIVMDALDQALPMLEAIKAELEFNPRLKMDFPEAAGQGRLWQMGTIVTANDRKVQVFGSGKRMRGLRHGPHRPDLVICDDLENDENVRSPEQRDKLQGWLTKTVLSLGAADDSMDVIVIGTILHYDSVLARLMSNPLWRSRKFRAIERWPDRMDMWERWETLLLNEGEAAAAAFHDEHEALMLAGAVICWPAGQPLLRLMVKRARDGRTAFDSEQQNDPVSGENAPFEGCITFWVNRLSHWQFYGACDPSLGRAGGSRDPSAILVGGRNRESGILDVVEAAIRKRVPDRIIEDVIALQAQYHCLLWVVEAVQFQEFLRTELVKRGAARGVPVPARGVTPHADKVLRIEALQPHMKNGLIRLHPDQTTLIDQLRHFPSADHDDGPDALEMLWQAAAGGFGGARGQEQPRRPRCPHPDGGLLMAKPSGLYIDERTFLAFAESPRRLSDEIATRARSPDFAFLGLFLPNPDPVLKKLGGGKDIQVYRELLSDAHVGGCARRRRSAVKSLEWGIDRDKARSRTAKLVEDAFGRLQMDRIIGQMLDAPLFGYQPLEVMWGKVGGAVVPVDLVAKPPHWFVYGPTNDLRFRSKDRLIEGEELPARKFLCPRQDPRYDNPYGFPDLSMVFWPTTFKKGGLKFWLSFTEKFGMPWAVGKYPRGTTEDEQERILARLAEMVQDAVAVIPDDSSVEIHEAAGKGASADLYERLLMFCRSEVSIALLGQNQTTEAEANRASATAGMAVTRELRDGDVQIVCEAMNELIGWIVTLNAGDGAPRPVFSMWEQEETDVTIAERDAVLTRAGAKFTPAYFKRRYALQDGDLDETAATEPREGLSVSSITPGDEAAAQFAEIEEAPDQAALDAALAALPAAAIDAAMRAALTPVVRALAGGESLDAAGDRLLAAFPELDTTAVEALLARALFVADLWGRISAAEVPDV